MQTGDTPHVDLGDALARPPSADSSGRAAEIERLNAIRTELAALQPWGALTADALAQLRRHYDARWEALQSPATAGQAPEIALAAAGDTPSDVVRLPGEPGAAAPDLARRSGPTLQEFLADRSILIVSYAGAFLLIVATLLFEVYGAAGLGGFARFAAVLALDLAFGAAAWFCLVRPNLRLVGTTYVAIFALTAPLVFAAAYSFLALRQYGISRDLAVALAGAGCAALYGTLAIRLRSEGYAALSLAALGAGWIGAVHALPLREWDGAAFAPLATVYCVVGDRAGRAGPGGRVFARRASLFVHAAALGALGWTVVAISVAGDTKPGALWPLAATFGEIAVAYAVWAWLPGRLHRLWLAAAAGTCAALAGVASTGARETVAALVLVALAWAYAAAARVVPAPPWRRPPAALHPFRVLAGLQSGAAVFLSVQPDAARAAVLLAASVAVAFLAVDAAAPAWLLLALAIFSVDWFWLAKAVVPPPPDAGGSALLVAYSPLPVVLATAAFGAVRLAMRAGSAVPGRRWAAPFLAIAAVNACWILLGALADGEWTLLGRLLIVYAGVTYGVALRSRIEPVAGVAALGAVGGAGSLLHAAAAPPAVVALVVAAAAWAIYGGDAAWQRYVAQPGAAPTTPPPAARGASGALRTQRLLAFGVAGLTALGCMGVDDLTRAGSPGAFAALGVLLALAAMVFVDGRRQARPVWDYAAGLIAVAGSGWIAAFFALTNPQWYVALPGLWLIWSGYAVRRDTRLSGWKERPTAARWSVGPGAFLLLGTTAGQALGDEAAPAYTVALVMEGIAAMLGGILLRDRTLVIGGAAAIAVGALRALLLILQDVPLFIIFGGVAIALLVAGALLAGARDRLAGARAAVTAWADWD